MAHWSSQRAARNPQLLLLLPPRFHRHKEILSRNILNGNCLYFHPGLLRVYWVETNTPVAPGKMGDYLNWLKNDYRPALAKAGVSRFQVARPIFGAVAGEIVTMRMLKNLAEIDAGTVLSRAVSDQEAREIAAKAVPLVSSSNTRIVRMRSDLSYAERW
jgi:hypothetical protein